MQRYSIAVLLVVSLTLTSCVSWHQNREDYRYVDDGNLTLLTGETAASKDPEIFNFPVYGALSESVYLNDDPSEGTIKHTLKDFCAADDSLFRPPSWKKLHNLKILNERRKAHDDIKLEVEAFTHPFADNKSVALIVFRGTDADQREDWTSNFRWFNRYFHSRLDQYDEVRILTPKLVDEIERLDDTVDRFIAVGHSLGGGLAQLAGYSTHKITTVIAFNPSPVTGFYDIEDGLRRFNAQNLKIYRAYEHPEALTYPRFIMKQIYPVSRRNPDIVQIRFNLIEGIHPTKQHEMKRLTCAMYIELQQYAPEPLVWRPLESQALYPDHLQ
ncbi:hypothetical protein ACWJJH_02505 [Endozoicomonadaceae bacterium StTr2]